jgi:choline dehydrogenase-like flavoprotein
VLCVAAPRKGVFQNKEIPMPFLIQRDSYIVSPYFDYVSFFFNKRWRHPAEDMLALMIKLADTNSGSATRSGVTKVLTHDDEGRLHDGVRLCHEVLCRLGAKENELFLGTMNAGHPGGMLPLTAHEASTLHHVQLPGNLYVADATLLPRARGNPPSLTIMALAKRVSKVCLQEWAA